MSFNGKISQTPKPPENRSAARVETVLAPPAKVNKVEPIQAPVKQPVVRIEKASAIVRPAAPSSAQVNIGPSPQPIAPSKIVDTTARPPAPPGAAGSSGDATPFPVGLAAGGALGQGQRVTVVPPKSKAIPDQLEFNATVPARTTVKTSAQCQRFFRGEEILVTSGEGLKVRDIFVGHLSQCDEADWRSDGRDLMSLVPTPLGAGRKFSVLDIGHDFTFVLENPTDEAIQFSTTIKGRSVE